VQRFLKMYLYLIHRAYLNSKLIYQNIHSNIVLFEIQYEFIIFRFYIKIERERVREKQSVPQTVRKASRAEFDGCVRVSANMPTCTQNGLVRGPRTSHAQPYLPRLNPARTRWRSPRRANA
jgi:hypothetical protein